MGNYIEQYPGSIANYNRAANLITAYYMDEDLLSNFQDVVHTLFVSSFPVAIGKRVELDGPYDFADTIYSAIFVSAMASGQPWDALAASAGALVNMYKSHLIPTLEYGLLDEEGLFGSLTVDALGYYDYSW